LVRKICDQVRYQGLRGHDLQQVCYDVFVEQHPPHPLPNPGQGSHSLAPGANELPDAELPAGWELFIGDARITYTHATTLPWRIAGQLAELVRTELADEPFELQYVDART
jgi:hypothetical protein